MISKRYIIKKIALLCTSTLLQATTPEINLLDGVKAHKNKLAIAINQDFKKKYLTGNFFAEYDADINLEQFDYSILSMPCITNIVSIVWISGKTYYVDEMDTDLFFSLKRVKKVFKTMYPETQWKGKLLARKLVDHHFQITDEMKNRTALLFSGGIDSTSTVYGHLDKKQLLITAWGHWDLPLNEHSLWKTRKNKTVEFAKKLGNEATFIRSNYSSILNWQYLNTLSTEIPKWRLGVVEGLGWAGLTAPVLLAKGYPVLRIASSHTWLYPYPSASSPYVDNNLEFCSLRVLHDQYDMTRIAKIEFIAKIAREKKLDKPFLKICSLEKKNDKNCCNCRKCLSSIIGFFAIGEDPKAYGMHISLATTYERTRELIAPAKLNSYTILYFKGVQKRIRARIAKKENVPKELLALAQIDFEKKKTIESATQHRIDLTVMQKFLPSLKIPKMVDGMPVFEQ